MSVTDWQRDPESWSTTWIGGNRLPGVSKVTGAVGTDLDVQKPQGQDGAFIKDKGVDPAKLTLTWRFIPQDFAEVLRIIEDIHPNHQGGKRKPLALRHARTDALRIHSVYVQKIGTPDIDDRLVGSVEMSLLQWVPEPKPAKPKGNSIKSSRGTGFEGPLTFVQPFVSPTTEEVLRSDGALTVADEEFVNFMNSAI